MKILRTWGFLTNHAHVLIQIARNPRSTVREIALATGITERAVISVLQDLRMSGIAIAEREGRQNIYWVDMAAMENRSSWAASDSNVEIPRALMEATVRGLSRLAARNGGRGKRPAAGIDRAVRAGAERRWGFLTTHALMLIHVIQHPRSTVREIALAVGVTERAAHSALQDLREAGIIERHREGRRNRYTVNFDHLASYRREGTAPDLVPGAFVSFLLKALLELRPAV